MIKGNTLGLSKRSIEEQLLRRKLAKLCRLLFKQGVVSLYEGNVSYKMSDRRFYIKKTGLPFRTMNAADFVLIDEKGNALTTGTPSREKLLHLKIYHNREDVNCIVHTHPNQVIRAVSRCPESTEFSEWRIREDEPIYLGPVPIVKFLPPGSEKLAGEVAEALKEKDRRAAILREHGLVVVGSSIEEAFDLTVFIDKRCELTARIG
jgi:L-fuculose-phosphate aldolase